MAYKHGLYVSEVPTSIVAPVEVDSALPVFFVTAPVHLAKDPYAVTNVPKLCYTYKEAVEYFGYHIKDEIFSKYTAVEAIYSQFQLYAVAPIILINVLDPTKHKEDVTNGTLQIQKFEGVLEVDGVLIDTVKIKKGTTEYVLETDYSLAFNDDGFIVINAFNAELENVVVDVEYTKLDPTLVDEYDIIGGYNTTTGKNEGLEIINDLYPKFRKVIGQIVAPGFSVNSTVASIMETKASNINGCFRCMTLVDLPSDKHYTELAEFKNLENLVSTRQYLLYPKLRNGDKIFNYSTQMAGLIGLTDYSNGGVPYVSPSNQNLKINGLVNKNGDEVIMQNTQANYLNSQGITTAINFSKGWTAWGNETAIYPGSTDVKDVKLPVRRMFDWIGNSLILTYWSKVDMPLTNRKIDVIVNSMNQWLNSLTAKGYLLSGKVEFLQSDNSTTDMLNGDVKLKVMLTPPVPMKSAEFILEFNVDALNSLFA